MHKQLIHQANVISVEMSGMGYTRLIGNTAKSLQNYIHDMKEFIFEVTKPLTDKSSELLGFVKNYDAKRVVDETRYTDLMNKDMYVPEGMSSTILTLIAALEKSQDVMDDIVDSTIKPATEYFSLLLSTPDEMSRATISPYAKQIVLNRNEIKKVKQLIANCFHNPTHQSKIKFSEGFDKNDDWSEACNRLEHLTNRINANSPTAVAAKVNELVSVVDRLIVQMEASPEIYQANGVTGAYLAEIIFGIGEEVEYYAAHVHHVQVLANVMTQNSEMLKQALDNK